MFKKKPTIKPLAPLRTSDRRKLAQQIASNLLVTSDTYGGTESELRNVLLPENTRYAKFTTTTGSDLIPIHGTIYVEAESGHVLWVKVGDQPMFPTVYTLWKIPSLLPIVQTHPPVIEKLCTGADLMIPGLIGPPFPEITSGRLVGIAGSNRPEVPVAVGVCEIDMGSLEKVVGEKGRAIKLAHWVGDEVYKCGDPGIVPDVLGAEDITKLMEASNFEESKSEEYTPEALPGDSRRELSIEEIDNAFYSAALYGVHDHLTKCKTSLEFPLSSSNFISQFVLPYLPPASHFPPHDFLQNVGPHPNLTFKRTSWKNAAKFLKYLEKEGLVNTKTRGGGETVILKIIWDLGAVQNFRPYKLPEVSKGPTLPVLKPASETNYLAINSIYRPNGKAVKFFEAAKADPKGYYTKADLNQLLNKYIETESLSQSGNKRIVTLDPVLSNALSISSSPGNEKRDVLAQNLLQGCSPYYTITTLEGTSKPKPGTPPKISIVIENRQGKKTVTRVFGLEPFGIHPKGLAEELQKMCAGSSTVGQAVGLKPGLLEVMVQGSQGTIVGKVLEKRGIPPRWVEVIDKTRGKKK